jgi:H+/gluconate symporter-like permease
MAFHNFDVGRSIVRALVVGLASGMAAHHVFGLLDANVLGTKLGAILWIFLGLMAAIYVHQDNLHWRISSRKKPQPGKRIPRLDPAFCKKRLLDLLLGFAYWLVISLVSVIFITLNPILSLMVATLGGILLGVVLTKRFVLRNTKNKKNKLNHEGLEEEEERNKPRRTQRAQS